MQRRQTHGYGREEAEVVEGGADPPLPQGMEEDVVGGATLVAMELVEETVTLMESVWVLEVRTCLTCHMWRLVSNDTDVL